MVCGVQGEASWSTSRTSRAQTSFDVYHAVALGSFTNNNIHRTDIQHRHKTNNPHPHDDNISIKNKNQPKNIEFTSSCSVTMSSTTTTTRTDKAAAATTTTTKNDDNQNHTPTFGPFHRVHSTTQSDAVAAQQVASREIWGRPRQYSSIPQVQAYTGNLSNQDKGIEFFTTVPPDAGTAPRQARWTGPRHGVRIEQGFAKISVHITKNTQLGAQTTTPQEEEEELLAA